MCALVPYSSTLSRKTRANRLPSTPAVSPSRVQLFRNEHAREAYEKLNSKRKIWAERSMILDEVDPAIGDNLESRGWLSLLEIDHPLSTALIREFLISITKHSRIHCMFQLGLLLKQDRRRSKKHLMG